MAPLLGRKPYPLVKPLAEPPGPGEVYTIEHTKEAFTNKDEYEERLQMYSERIWTCRSTGSGQLTHREAWDEEQEVTELLQEEYPLWFEKPVLDIVHHNTISLDKVVDQVWLEIFTKYAVGEECDFLVGGQQSRRVKVLKVHPPEPPPPEEEAAEKKLEGACDSPSSDKENTTQENQKKEAQPREEGRRESQRDRARRSPRKLPTSLKEERRKWPKFLPLKYDVQLMEEEKVISNVPVDSLFRTERPPTKEIMRYFIRQSALRLGTAEGSPWVVEDELVKKYSLPSKLSDFLLESYKCLAENPAKRKSLSSLERRPAKKLKTGEAGEEGHLQTKKEEEEEKAKKKGRKISDGMPLSPTVSLLKLKNVGELAKAQDSKAAKRSRKSAGKNEEKSGPGGRTLPDPARGGATPGPPASPRKRARSTGPGTPKRSKPLPRVAQQLIRYYEQHKGREDRRNTVSCMVSKVAKALGAQDRARLPGELRALVQARWELLERKRNWAALSAQEKQEVMRRKRGELKERLREKRGQEQQARQELHRRFEDQALQGRSLPAFRLVDTPEGLPNALFGDVAMVTDFLNCYSGLLTPDGRCPVAARALMQALAGEGAGFAYLNGVLLALLQTLLQDELAEGYRELDVPLSEIPLTAHSASELVRLCLRPSDAQAGDSGRGSDVWAPDGYDDVLSADFLERLETAEVFELSAPEKVGLLVALCHRILMTYSAEDHVEAMQQRIAQLWKDRLATLKDANDRKRAQKQRQRELLAARGGAGGGAGFWDKVEGGAGGGAEDAPEPSGEKKEGGGKEAVGKAEVAPKAEAVPVPVEPEPDDMIRAVKSRRLMSIQAKKEKEEQERQTKERMEKVAEEVRIQRQKASAERAFQEGLAQAKLVMRRVSLGTDRNHNRYWLFSDQVPGLYIEKGWVHESVNYHFTLHEDEEIEEDDEVQKGACGSEGALAEGGPLWALQATDPIESTIPKVGQNLWCVCDTKQELEELMESLHPQGVREGELKSQLQSRYQDILRSIQLAQKPSLQLDSCDGHQELRSFLRSDIIDMASRLHKGGLGYMDDLTQFEERVRSLEKLKDLGECVIALQACVIKKFLQGFMAPKQKKRRKHGGVESAKPEEVDEEKRLVQEAKVATAVERWRSAIREAQTFSRMHVLLGMLDACVKWDMSAENARCKVCRKKGEDDKLVLCDDCNKAFHLFCLRPVLYSIPQGDWQCPACQPATARRSSRARNHSDDTDDEEDSRQEEHSEEDEEVEEDEEDRPYAYLRSRKRPKVKELSSHTKASGKTASKSSRPRGPPSNPADIDELVRQCSGSAPRRLVMELARCEEIVHKLLKFHYSWPFRDPVSPDEAEDYQDVVSNPMDLKTMLAKFSSSQYRHPSDFVEDMKLVFSNAEAYNQPGSAVLSCLALTEKSFTTLLQKHLPGVAYLRRRHRQRGRQPQEEEEEEEEQEEERVHRKRVGRPRKLVKEEEEEEEEERRVYRKRVGRPRKVVKEKEEEEEEERRVYRKRVGRPRKVVKEEEEEEVQKSGRKKRRGRPKGSARRRNAQREEEEEEEEEEADPTLRRSRRAVVSRSARKDYREQESEEEEEEEEDDEESEEEEEEEEEGEWDNRRTRPHRTRGGAKARDEYRPGQRHSKRQKRSI